MRASQLENHTPGYMHALTVHMFDHLSSACHVVSRHVLPYITALVLSAIARVHAHPLRINNGPFLIV
jgi:hypothetical protein